MTEVCDPGPKIFEYIERFAPERSLIYRLGAVFFGMGSLRIAFAAESHNAQTRPALQAVVAPKRWHTQIAGPKYAPGGVPTKRTP